jgi:peptidoglycan/LPS O-acetylase OafA/YrhL
MSRFDRLRGLDGLRGVAAIAVVVHHAQKGFGLQHFADSFYLAVEVFFILSGIVLARRYEESIAESWTGAWRFMTDRLTRLYPLHIAAVLASALLVASTGRTSILADVFMLQGIGLPIVSFNLVSWSACTELWANLIYALLLRCRLGGRAVLIGTIGACTYVLQSNYAGSLALSYNPTDVWVGAGLLMSLAGFMLGVCLYRTVFASGLHTAISDFGADLGFAVCCGGLVLLSVTNDPTNPNRMHDYFALFCFLPGLLLFAAAPGGYVQLVLRSAPLQWLGRISYSIYLLQFLVWHLWFNSQIITSPPYQGIAYLVSLLCLSEVSFRLIERKGGARMRELFSQRWIKQRTSSEDNVSVALGGPFAPFGTGVNIGDGEQSTTGGAAG